MPPNDAPVAIEKIEYKGILSLTVGVYKLSLRIRKNRVGEREAFFPSRSFSGTGWVEGTVFNQNINDDKTVTRVLLIKLFKALNQGLAGRSPDGFTCHEHDVATLLKEIHGLSRGFRHREVRGT